MKLKKLAELVAGELVGGGDAEIKRISAIEDAGAGDLVFVHEDKFLASALSSKAAAVIVPRSAKVSGKPAILVNNTRLALALLLPHFLPKTKTKPGIHKSAVVAASAKIGKRVTIHPFVYVGEDCEVGDDSVLHPHVTLYDRVKIGRRVVVHSGTRIGVDGYGFVWHEGKYVKIPQIGSVTIEDDVELFANVTVARATLGVTRIGAGSKVDCLTHIAHNCELGKDCALTSLIGLAGSVTLKDHVSVGGMAGFNGHITVGENTVIMAKAGVTKDIPANSVVSGFPAIDHKKDLEVQAFLHRLPELYKKFKAKK